MNQAQFAMPKMTPLVRLLLIATGVLFVLQLGFQQFAGFSLAPVLGFVPMRLLDGWIWQLFTYSVLHDGLMHLLFNGLILWTLGAELERLWGTRFFAVYYGSCVLGAALAYGVLSAFGVGSTAMPVIGSSGGVYGLLVAYGILFGERVLYFFMVFPMQARYFVLVLGAIELISSVFYSNRGIAHVAHLGGMLTGFLVLTGLAQWRSRERNAARNGLKAAEDRQNRLKKSGHLRLIGEEEDKPKRWH